jgi:LysM repeat protein
MDLRRDLGVLNFAATVFKTLWAEFKICTVRPPPLSKAGILARGFYIGGMKRFWLVMVALVIAASSPVHAQDAALEERVNKLNGYVQDLLAAQDAQRKQIEALSKEVGSLREKLNQANPDAATQDDLRKLTEKLQEIDKKRADDRNLILKEIENLGKSARAPKPSPRSDTTDTPPRPTGNDKGYEYEVKPGDTISAVVAAYRDQGIKVTVDSILKANPGLKPTNMQVGQKLFIPAPQ